MVDRKHTKAKRKNATLNARIIDTMIVNIFFQYWPKRIRLAYGNQDKK